MKLLYVWLFGAAGTLQQRAGRLAVLVDGWDKDLSPGQGLVNCFRPFLERLAGSDLSPKTIQRHVDNRRTLGGGRGDHPPPQ